MTQDNTSLVKRSAFSKKYFKEIPKLLTLKKIEIIENQANHCTLPTKNPKKWYASHCKIDYIFTQCNYRFHDRLTPNPACSKPFWKNALADKSKLKTWTTSTIRMCCWNSKSLRSIFLASLTAGLRWTRFHSIAF